jgi:hypothetical protein
MQKKNEKTNNPEGVEQNKLKQRIKDAYERANNLYTEKYILWDSRKSDRKKGMDNDLTREHIKEQIDKGCSYCGETKLRMTLDRINNDKGHTKNNTVPACIRCNFIRGSMPHKAWLSLVPSIKETNDKGLFGDWIG